MRDPDYIANAIVQDMIARTPAPLEPRGGGLDLGASQEWSDTLALSPALVARLWSDGTDNDRADIDAALAKRRERQSQDQKTNQ